MSRRTKLRSWQTSRRIVIRLDAADWEAVDRWANRAMLEPTEWIERLISRELLRAEIRRAPSIPIPDYDAAKRQGGWGVQ